MLEPMTSSLNKDNENKTAVGKWIKHNSLSTIIPGQDVNQTEDSNENSEKISNIKDISTNEVVVIDSNTEISKTNENITILKISNGTQPKKQCLDESSNKTSAIIPKQIVRQSKPVEVKKLPSICDKVPSNLPTIKKIPSFTWSIESVKSPTNNANISPKLKDKPVITHKSSFNYGIGSAKNSKDGAKIFNRSKIEIKTEPLQYHGVFIKEPNFTDVIEPVLIPTKKLRTLKRKSNSGLKGERTIKKEENFPNDIETVLIPTKKVKVLNRKLNPELKVKTTTGKVPNLTCNIESVTILSNNEKVKQNIESDSQNKNEKTLVKKKTTLASLINPLKNSTNKNKFSNSKSNFQTKANITIQKVSSSANISNSSTSLTKNKQILNIRSPAENIKVLNTGNSVKNKQISNEKFDPDLKAKAIVKKIPSFSCTVESVRNSEVETDKQNHACSNSVELIQTVQKSTIKTPPVILENKNEQNNMSNKSQVCNSKNVDVYKHLLDSHRYIVIPKTWCVIDLLNDTQERCIVFYNPCIIRKSNVFISVIKKSLIIDKNATINYSVYGLPINTIGTILPKSLDDTKKLLSILHIFDKMQICEGLGNDVEVISTFHDSIFKDSLHHWRHNECRIILIKSTRCSHCNEVRNTLLTKTIVKSEPM